MPGVYVDLLLIYAGCEQLVLVHFIRDFELNTCCRLETASKEIFWLLVEGCFTLVTGIDSIFTYIL